MSDHASIAATLQPWHYRTSGGLVLRGWRARPRGRPVLTFLHGNGLCGAIYWPCLRHLSADFDLVLLDLPGHGDSDPGPRFLGWNENAELAHQALLAVLPDYGAAPVIACGHSFGGVLTLLMLAGDPVMARAGLLLDPVLFTPSMLWVMQALRPLGLWQQNGMARRARQRRFHWPDRHAARTFLQGRGMFREWTEDSMAAYVEHGLRAVADGFELKCAPRREAEIFASHPRQLWARVDALRRPLMILHGERTYPFVPASAHRAARRNPRIDVAAVPGTHFYLLEDPEGSASILRHHLASLSQTHLDDAGR